MKFEKYYSPDKTEFRGYIIEHNGMYLSTTADAIIKQLDKEIKK